MLQFYIRCRKSKLGHVDDSATQNEISCEMLGNVALKDYLQSHLASCRFCDKEPGGFLVMLSMQTSTDSCTASHMGMNGNASVFGPHPESC